LDAPGRRMAVDGAACECPVPELAESRPAYMRMLPSLGLRYAF
jgi:hypothetical protein